MSGTVLVLGGGVGGMTAAQELAERGFSVTVLEARGIPGGKARSVPVPRSGKDGRADLPGEHGFRFFPGFYRLLPDTMRRIPYRDQTDGVLGNLRPATEAEIARAGEMPPIRLPVRFPVSTSDLGEIVRAFVHPDFGISKADRVHFCHRLLTFLTSCDERRYGEWENQSWWEFVGADERSAGYQRFLADGLTRTLVAARAKEMSARTGGSILLQLLFDLGVPGRVADRVLNGPTNEVWIGPWRDHLEHLGVNYRVKTTVEEIVCEGGHISSLVATGPNDEREELRADWYVGAIPVEQMARLATPAMKEAEPALDLLPKLHTRWMNGILFYLREDQPIVHGHVIYIDSEWSLTSVSQRQFWATGDLSGYGAGDVGGILSVDISDWYTPGPVTGKSAMECTREEVLEEVWAQLDRHFHGRTDVTFDRSHLVQWFLDDDVHFPHVRKDHGVRLDVNLEPLLVNTVGSWEWRPEAVTRIENLFLASDYVRTHTDLATMEAANEAARRAVNGILEASGSREPPCEVWPLHEPEVFAPAKRLDRWRFERGLRHEVPDEHATADG